MWGLLLTTCGWTGLATVPAFAAEQAAPDAKAPIPAYRLCAGDEVAVAVAPQKGFDSGGIVLPDGSLYLRNVGKVRAAGMTIDELTAHILKVLDADLVDPRVTVSLVKTAPTVEVKAGQVTLVGAVAKSGPLALEPGLRVRKALDLAGGTLKDADLKNVVILHPDLTRTVVDLSTDQRVSDPAHNRTLKDGDSIEVKFLAVVVARPVRIAGQVLNPGQYDLKAGMTVEDLVITAGKLSSLADVEKVELRRTGEAPRQINLVERQKLGLAGKVTLSEGDEIFIPEQRDRVILIGAVPRPGPHAIKPGTSLARFFLDGSPELAAALNPAVVDLGDVQLIRPGQKPVKINLARALKKPEDRDNVALQAGDVLFLPPRKTPRRDPLDYLAGGFGPLGLLFGLF